MNVETAREDAEQMYSRGAGPGFLAGIDHQRLVEGRACDHRGLRMGVFGGVRSLRGRSWLRVALDAGASLAKGDGLLIEGGRGDEGELGGRVWAVCDERGAEREAGVKGPGDALAWLGPEKESALREAPPSGRRVWKTDDPAREKAVLAAAERAPRRVAVDVTVRGRFGEKPVFEARTEQGVTRRVEAEGALEPARGAVLPLDVLREKLGRMGDGPFVLRELRVELPEEGALLPLSWVNRARRALVEALVRASVEDRAHATTERTAEQLIAAAVPPADRAPAPAGLFVLCRTIEQARARITRAAPTDRASSTDPASVQVICVLACTGRPGATARTSRATPRSCTITASTPAAAHRRTARSSAGISASKTSVFSATYARTPCSCR